MVELGPGMRPLWGPTCDAAMIDRYDQAAGFMVRLASARPDQELMQQQIEGLGRLGLDVNIGFQMQGVDE